MARKKQAANGLPEAPADALARLAVDYSDALADVNAAAFASAAGLTPVGQLIARVEQRHFIRREYDANGELKG